jgi:hypothetical protein
MAYDVVTFAVMLHAVCAEEFIHGKTDSHSAGIADGFFCVFDQFAQKANTVFK